MTVQEDLEILRGAGQVIRRYGIDPSVGVETADRLVHDSAITRLNEQLAGVGEMLVAADRTLQTLDLSLLTTNSAAEVAGVIAHVEKAQEKIADLNLRSPITLCKEA